MTTDATGHRTPDTGHRAPELRAPIPDTTTDAVPLYSASTPAAAGHRTPDTGRPARRRYAVRLGEPDGPSPDTTAVPFAQQRDTTTNGTPDTQPNGTAERDTQAPDRPANRTPDGTPGPDVPRPSGPVAGRLFTRLRAARDTRKAALRDTADAQRVARDIAQHADTLSRDALVREAVAKRRRPVNALLSEAEKIAPIPPWMQKASVWGDRVIGALLPTAPLLVSGYATVQVGKAEPLNMGWMAIFFTLGLEGAVWYLNRLREQFRLENDGTFSIGMAIYGIVALIAGLIGGHAIWAHTGQIPIDITVPGTQSKVPLSELTPAIAIAVMSGIGTFIWAKKATYKHRAKLRSMNMIDPRAPKFATGAWVTSPWETAWSLRHFFKYRIEGGAALVVADWRFWKATGKPKIWPVPAGFRYVSGKLVQLTVPELEEVARREALIAGQYAEITGRDTWNGTGHRDGTAATTGHQPAGRPALTNGTPDGPHGTARAGQPAITSGTPDTHFTGRPVEPNGTARAGQYGTPDTRPARDDNGTANGAHGTVDRAGNGTPDTNRTPDTNGTGQRDTSTDATADALRDSGYIMIVAEEIPGWATQEKVPSINNIIDAIHRNRLREGGQFKSRDIAGRVRQHLLHFRQNPDAFDLINQIEGGSTPRN